MPTTYFGFAFSASMLPAGSVSMSKEDLTVEEVSKRLPQMEMCLNPFHIHTVNAAVTRFGLPITVPESPARVSLEPGDSVVVMQVLGLPRGERREYTAEEIAVAEFSFLELTLDKPRELFSWDHPPQDGTQLFGESGHYYGAYSAGGEMIIRPGRGEDFWWFREDFERRPDVLYVGN